MLRCPKLHTELEVGLLQCRAEWDKHLPRLFCALHTPGHDWPFGLPRPKAVFPLVHLHSISTPGMQKSFNRQSFLSDQITPSTCLWQHRQCFSFGVFKVHSKLRQQELVCFTAITIIRILGKVCCHVRSTPETLKPGNKRIFFGYTRHCDDSKKLVFLKETCNMME